MTSLRPFREFWNAFITSHSGILIKRWSRRLFVLGILGYLLFQFRDIGWQSIWDAMPVQPLFYLLYLPIFFMLPVSELFIYRTLWGIDFREIWPVLVIKKVFNYDVLGYSGELYLFNWARQRLQNKTPDILREIKDNNIISSLVSTIVTLLALLLFFDSNPGTFTRWYHAIPNNQIWYALISGAVILTLILRFKKYLVSLPMKTGTGIFLIHLARHLFGFTIQILQWHIVLPNVPWYMWFTFMAVHLLMTRLPLLPSMDLIFLGVSITLTKAMGGPLAAITAIMTVNSVLGKLLHVGYYSYYNYRLTKRGEGVCGETAGATERADHPITEV